MLNLINPYDILELAQEVYSRGPNWLIRRLKPGKSGRVTAAWRDKAASRDWPDHLIRHNNQLITGASDQEPISYFAGKYCTAGTSVHALSLGCGDGTHELKFAKTGKFTRIDGYDLSPARIERAKERALEAGLSGVLNFEVKDFLKSAGNEEAYDIVIVIGSLHHFSPLEQAVHRISEYLKPGGLLYVHEFVGPSKWQWETTQLAAANSLLKQIPPAFRKRKTGFVLKRIWKPGLLRMYFSDPSEAVESDRIVPLLDKYFERLEYKPLGGALTQLVFGKIAHNFLTDDRETRTLIDTVLTEEAVLMESDRIDSDFLFGVYKKPAAPENRLQQHRQ